VVTTGLPPTLGRYVPPIGSVYVIGAGFSKAVNAAMPTVDELGKEVLPYVTREVVDDRLLTERFEEWLSFAAGDAPWLSEPERLALRSVFLEASRGVASVIGGKEVVTRTAALPEWLAQLVVHWHQTRAAVVTFNYDTLIESAYTQVVRVKVGTLEGNSVSPLQLYRIPIASPWSRVGGAWGPTLAPTFGILKLHGSRDWFYTGSDSFSGEPIYGTYFGQGWQPKEGGYPDYLTAGLVPLVVPPTTDYWRRKKSASKVTDRV
jgi:hypothetical protein